MSTAQRTLLDVAVDALIWHARLCRACAPLPGPLCPIGADLRPAVIFLAERRQPG